MFGLFQRKKKAKWIEKGRRAAQGAADALENFMDIRFKPVSQAFLDHLQKEYNKCLNSTEAPPLIAARIEYKVFLENVEALPDKMVPEITAALSDWMDIIDKIQSRHLFLELVRRRVQKFCDELTGAGLQRLIDMAHALKAADDEWRAANPELAAEFPPES
jgi:hypothetical protein